MSSPLPTHSPREVAAPALQMGSDSSGFGASCRFANGTSTNPSPLPQAVSVLLSTASPGPEPGLYLAMSGCHLYTGPRQAAWLALLHEGWLWSLPQALWVLFGPLSSGGNSTILQIWGPAHKS